MATNVTPSQQINLSKDRIRTDLIENFVKQYLELENVDLTQSSYMSFLVDVFSTLSSNLLFYQTSVYREFFLTTAQLPESVLNLSRFLGYNTKEAVPASTNILVSVPLSFDDTQVYFKIPGNGSFPDEIGESKFRFYAGSTEFVNDQKIEVFLNNTFPQSARIKYTDINGTSFITNGVISNTTTPAQLKFLIPVRQVKKINLEYQVDSNLRSFQFHDIDVPIPGHIASLSVRITPPNVSDGSGTFWKEYDSLYLMNNSTEGYVSRRTENGRKIFFGNDLMGVQPKPGSKIEIFVETTEGELGNVIKGSISSADRVYHSNFGIYNTTLTRPKIVEFTVVNTNSATGGADEESIDNVRINSINSLTSLSRLVSENDYKNLKSIVTNLPISENTLPILKRSDTRINEIQLYTALTFNDEIVPTRSIFQTFPISTKTIKRNDVLFVDGTDEYLSLFNLNFDAEIVPNGINSDVAKYTYYISSANVSPILEDTNSIANYNIYCTNFVFTRNDSIARSSIYTTYFSDETDDSTDAMLNKIEIGTDHLRATATVTLLSNGQVYDLQRPYIDSTTSDLNSINKMFIELISVPTGMNSDSAGWVILSSDSIEWQTTNIHAYKFEGMEGNKLLLSEIYDDTSNGINGTVKDYDGLPVQILLEPDYFTFFIDDLEDEHFDDGNITFAISYFHPEVDISGPITRSTAALTIRQSADQFMLSNMTIDRYKSELTIFDIPVVSKEYYENLVSEQNTNDFELLVMQKLLEGVQFHNYRMLTDFLNLKMTNTTGSIRSFQYNKTTKPNVISRNLTAVPWSPSVGNSYIINGKETGTWSSMYSNSQLKDKIATWNGTSWSIIDPSLEDVVAVNNEYYDGTTYNLKLFFSEFGWIVPDYEIPLVIECEIYPKTSYSGGNTALVNNVKTKLLEVFTPRFGSNISLHRSEIISAIHEISGVDHVRLISPKTSIYFDFETSDLDEDQLLKYGPEYIFFNESSIIIRVR